MKKKLFILAIGLLFMAPASYAQDKDDLPEAPRHRILPFKDSYQCNGKWQKVMTRRNRNNLSVKYIGYRCLDDPKKRRKDD